jgi:hypothetical protein
LDSEALRVVITKEIMDYHQPKASLLEYALRPVPRDELEQSGILQPSLSSSSSASLMAGEATLKSVLETTGMNSNCNETDALAVKTKHCGTDNVDMISATPKRSSLVDTDTVMLSAQAVNFEENCGKPEGHSGKPEDKLQFETGVVQSVSTQAQPSVADSDQSSVTDAKALIKAALLNSDRRKQQMGNYIVFTSAIAIYASIEFIYFIFDVVFSSVGKWYCE